MKSIANKEDYFRVVILRMTPGNRMGSRPNFIKKGAEQQEPFFAQNQVILFLCSGICVSSEIGLHILTRLTAF